MAVSRRQVSASIPHAGPSASPITITPTVPLSALSSSVVVVFISVTQNSNDGGNAGINQLGITTPGGWSSAAPLLQGSNTFPISQIFWATGFTGTSQAFTITSTVANTIEAQAVMIELTGVNTINPINVISSLYVGNTNGTFSGPAATPLLDSCAGYVFASTDDELPSFSATNPSGQTVLITGTNNGSNAQAQLCTVNALSTSGTTFTSQVIVNAWDTGGAILAWLVYFTPAISLKSLTATASSSGSLVKRTAYKISAASSFIGTLLKRTTHSAFTATSSFVGSLVPSHLILKLLTAGLSDSGVVTRRALKIFSGVLAPSTSMVRFVVAKLIAALAPSAVFVKTTIMIPFVASATNTAAITFSHVLHAFLNASQAFSTAFSYIAHFTHPHYSFTIIRDNTFADGSLIRDNMDTGNVILE